MKHGCGYSKPSLRKVTSPADTSRTCWSYAGDDLTPLEDFEARDLIECHKEGQFLHSRTIPETIAEYTESLALFRKAPARFEALETSKHPRFR